jgi:gibberellin A4 carboxyl methyltransferase
VHAVTDQVRSITGMVGGGFYDGHSAPQRVAMLAVTDWFDDALAATLNAAADAAAITIADFGSAEGANAMAGADRLVRAIRRRSDQPVQAVFSDLESNDFNALLANGSAWSVRQAGVFPVVAAGSMFDQLLPAESVHVATSYNAIGYLSTRPAVGIRDYPLPMPPRYVHDRARVTEHERIAYRTHFQADLTRFYRSRHRELTAGGLLLVQCWGCDDTSGLSTSDGIFDALNEAMLAVVDAGGLTVAQWRAFVDPAVFPSLRDLLQPLDETASAAGLFTVERSSTTEVAVPFEEEFRRSGDVTVYADAYVGFVRAFAEPLLRMSLGDSTETDLTVAAIFEQMNRIVTAEPERYRYRYINVAVLMRRT